MDACFRAIPPLLPGRHFRRDQRLAVEPSVQTLAMHNVDLCFGHIGLNIEKLSPGATQEDFAVKASFRTT